MGNVRFRWLIWEACGGELLGGRGAALIAGWPRVVGGCGGQAFGGVEAGSLAARDEGKPDGVVCAWRHAGR